MINPPFEFTEDQLIRLLREALIKAAEYQFIDGEIAGRAMQHA
jgi:hypothetical protein